jgi:glycosyltransferase involved in cell wall biosynthesis
VRGNEMSRNAKFPLRVCRVVTVPQTYAALLTEQLQLITQKGMDLTIVSAPGPELTAVGTLVGAKPIAIPMRRVPAPASDLRSLWNLTQVFRKGRFDIVHSSTPKAGLLSALAGTLARVPVRMHTFTGQPWVELRGMKRQIARQCDRITAGLSTHCYADSFSQRDFLIRQGLVAPAKISVPANGSISGVNLERFSRRAWRDSAACLLRTKLGIPEESIVVVFLGRVTRDKGILELTLAHQRLCRRHDSLHTVLVGPLEPDRDPLPADVLSVLHSSKRIHCVGFTANPERYLALADIFCLPSYREGFGTVAIEAAAMGLPAVVSRTVGLVDAVEEDVTGLFVPAKNAEALASCLERLILSPELRAQLGRAGQARAESLFSSEQVNGAVVNEYFRVAPSASRQGSTAIQRDCHALNLD